ncbi:unnamed protein product, partial [Iphiclides podalirius]
MYFFIVTVLLILLILYAVKTKEPEPIFGIYCLPGKWYYLKYALFACLYYFQKYSKRNKAVGTDGRAGQGVKAIADPAAMDRAQLLSDHSKAFDAIFFISAASDENNKGLYVISGCERRPMGMCNGLFYIGLPGKGLLCSKKIPDTVLFGAQIGEFAAEGIKMEPLEPMKRWAVSYKGKMWYQNEPGKLVDVEFSGEWTATSKYFDYDTDLHPAAVIRSIAREKWSRQYFEGLRTAHQSHYEQFGVMKCRFRIEEESYELTLPSFRDHSFGHKRDWSLMHRYAFHHIFLEDGTSISVGVICQPLTATTMEMGVVGLPNGEVLPVKWVDLKLYQHGEGGDAPRDYAFRFQGRGQNLHNSVPLNATTSPTTRSLVIAAITVNDHRQVLVEYESVHYVSSEWEARMVERFCAYRVDGVRGRGVSEFHYRHSGGRPEAAARDDPEWYRKMCHKV